MRRGSLLLGLLVLVFLTALWWLFLMSPRRSDISDFGDQVEQLQLQEVNLRGLRAQLLEIQDSELSYIAASATMERLIPPTPELAAFIDDMNRLVADTGVTLVALNPGFPTQAPFAEFSQVAVAIGVEGQFFEVLGLLFGLDEVERLVRIDGISLATGDIIDGNVMLSANIDATIFTTAAVAPPPPEGGEGDGGEGG